MAKIRNYDGFGGCISAPINVKFGTWERTFTGQSVAYAGRKTHFRPLSKNNIGMAALRASLPVKKHHTFSSTAGARPTITTILGTVIEEVRAIFAPLTFIGPIGGLHLSLYFGYILQDG